HEARESRGRSASTTAVACSAALSAALSRPSGIERVRLVCQGRVNSIGKESWRSGKTASTSRMSVDLVGSKSKTRTIASLTDAKSCLACITRMPRRSDDQQVTDLPRQTNRTNESDRRRCRANCLEMAGLKKELNWPQDIARVPANGGGFIQLSGDVTRLLI